ncbi:hypothetical protein JXR93_11700 [bacterium]|nr:hypothetical protein [bacterium]
MGVFEISIILITIVIVIVLFSHKKEEDSSERVISMNEPKNRRNRIKKSEIFLIKDIFNNKKGKKTPRFIAFVEYQYDRSEDKTPNQVIQITLENILKSELKDSDFINSVFSTKNIKEFSYNLTEKTRKLLNSFLPQHIIITSLILEILNPSENPKTEKYFSIKRNLELPKRNTSYEIVCSFEDLDPSYIERLSYIILQNYSEKMLKQFDEQEFKSKIDINDSLKNININNINQSENDLSNTQNREFFITLEQVKSLFIGELFEIIEFHWSSEVMVSKKLRIADESSYETHFDTDLESFLYQIKSKIDSSTDFKRKEFLLEQLESKILLEAKDPMIMNLFLEQVEDIREAIQKKTVSTIKKSEFLNNITLDINTTKENTEYLNSEILNEKNEDIFTEDLDKLESNNKKGALFNDSFDLKVDSFD